MASIVKKMFSLLDRKERSQALWIFVLILIMGVIEVIGVASIMPFLAVLADPEIIQRSDKMAYVYNELQFQSTNNFLVALGGCVLAALILANFLSALTQRTLAWYTNMNAHSLSKRMLIHYLNQPYVYFLNRHSAKLSETILSEVNLVTRNVLVSIMQIAAKVVICIFILALLLAVDPFLTLITMSLLGGAYGLVYVSVRKKLSRISKERVVAATARHKAISEIFSGIKDIKVKGREAVYVQKYEEPSAIWARHQATHENISMLPRYIIETFAFGGIILIVLYLMIYRGGIGDALPMIGLFAFAGQRIMPGMQLIFMNITKIRFAEHALNHMADEIGNAKAESIKLQEDDSPGLGLEQSLKIENLSFSYVPDRPVLKNLNLSIKAYTTVGFVGGTGAGKTTLIDIILRLLEPNSGTIKADGQPLSADNRRLWQKSIGYVSQNIVLFDDTVAANIACGLSAEKINQDSVVSAASQAKLHEFIEKDLPQSYQTRIGENGVRLSGGQRQRLGIARALYSNPSLIIFDEATSALDNITEQAVMEAINSLNHKKTILMIAHRLSTVCNCDIIHVMEEGKIISSGSYGELLRTCPVFQRLAHAHENVTIDQRIS